MCSRDVILPIKRPVIKADMGGFLEDVTLELILKDPSGEVL